ncbi:MAG: trypsin-like serine peptidase [Silvanigrellaceae bacterium]
MRKSFVLNSMIASLLAGCDGGFAPHPEADHFMPKSLKNQDVEEKIIGENNLIPVTASADNLPVEMRHLVDAVGQLNLGCTATHIGSGLVLTAGHCISKSPRSSTNSCRHLGVVWGNRGGNTQLSASKCLEVKIRVYNDTLDYALLKVENPPAAFIPVETEPTTLTTPATMLSHPRMRPLEWSGICGLSVYEDPKRASEKFFHSCDSEGGSSGAAILSRESLRIIGIHNGASDELNYGIFITAITDLAKLITSADMVAH